MKQKKHSGLFIGLSAIVTFSLFVCMAFIQKDETGREVLLQTAYGTMRIRLYDETPKHRDNMIKLVNEKFYDSLLFHRVIKGFMIQCGDPLSKGAAPGKQIGFGGPGYTVSAEFSPPCIHKKGAVAAARLGDAQNPMKASSGSQFYIVQGKTYTDDELTAIENQRIEKKTFELVRAYLNKPENRPLLDEIVGYQKAKEQDKMNAKIDEVKKTIHTEIADLDKFRYTKEQRSIYKTIGGTPNLDFEYTVFGEVVDGMNVIDSIASVETVQGDRPKTDVIMKMTVVK